MNTIYIGLGLLATATIGLLYFRRRKQNQALLIDRSPQSGSQESLTIEEIALHDGIQKSSVYIAIKDVIFDVSSSANYQKGGNYQVFAGKEISVALAKMAFEDKYFNAYNNYKLDKKELATLNGWIDYMKGKYKIVGNVSQSKKQD